MWIIINETRASANVSENDVVAAGSPVIPMIVPKKMIHTIAAIHGANVFFHVFGSVESIVPSIQFTNVSPTHTIPFDDLSGSCFLSLMLKIITKIIAPTNTANNESICVWMFHEITSGSPPYVFCVMNIVQTLN